MKIDYIKILECIYQEVQPLFGQGQMVNYIPVLSEVSSQKFGMAVRLVSGEEYRSVAASWQGTFREPI